MSWFGGGNSRFHHRVDVRHLGEWVLYYTSKLGLIIYLFFHVYAEQRNEQIPWRCMCTCRQNEKGSVHTGKVVTRLKTAGK